MKFGTVTELREGQALRSTITPNPSSGALGATVSLRLDVRPHT